MWPVVLQNAHNVLVASSPVARHGLVAKVADLGLSRVLKQQATHRTTSTVSARLGYAMTSALVLDSVCFLVGLSQLVLAAAIGLCFIYITVVQGCG
jgi:hypothetical protein